MCVYLCVRVCVRVCEMACTPMLREEREEKR
jgi:hypothetical protein